MAKKRARYGFLFVLPYIVVFLIFQLYPIIYTFFLSMEDGATAGFIGLKNYQRLAVDEVFWKSGKHLDYLAWLYHTADYIRAGAGRPFYASTN